jgi:hypothetical protein
MATHSIPEPLAARPPRPSSRGAINILARQAAKKAVKEELRDQGVRVSLVKPAEIAAKAQAYLADHPEVCREALRQALRMKLPGAIYWGELEQAI